MPWGDSSQLKVAEWVLAIGNPFQLNQSVTLRIVSATGRRLEQRLATYEDFIQTDAAINPATPAARWSTPRRARRHQHGDLQRDRRIPGHRVRRAKQSGATCDERTHPLGEVQRGTIVGITLQPLTTRLAEQLGAPNTHGMVVVSMQQRSDAYLAGFAPAT